jgi:hypothetical protein
LFVVSGNRLQTLPKIKNMTRHPKNGLTHKNTGTKRAGPAWQPALFFMAALGILLFNPATALAQEPYLDMSALPATPPAAGGPPSILCTLLIGVLLGVGGQIARSAVGLKKEMDKARPKAGDDKWYWFNMQELLVSLLLGGAAGAFAAVLMMGAAIDNKFLMACIGAGYAGSDFIQGFMHRELPAAADEAADNAKADDPAPKAGNVGAVGGPEPQTKPKAG